MDTFSGQWATANDATTTFGSISALIVDDESHVRSYLRLVLAALGVTAVWEAADGAEGLALYEQHRPAVVLLDVNMPVMSGERMLEELTQLDPAAAVIMVTAQNEHETVKRFARLGAMGYLLKHLPKDELSRQLAEMLECLVDEDAA